MTTYQKILELEAKSGREALDGKSMKMFHGYRFLCEFENGGLSGFLYNISPAWDDLSDLSVIAMDLNRPELGNALTKAGEIARGGPEDYHGTWGDWLELADPNDELSEQDQIISEHYDILWEDLEWIVAND